MKRSMRLRTRLIGLVLAVSAPALGAMTGPVEWRFQVFLDDTEIGQHHFRLQEDAQHLLLTSEARFQVKFLFFTAYQYRHRSSERWADQCLASIEATTDDNGDRYRVFGMATEGRFLLQDSNTPSTLDGCVRSFAYWNPELLHSDKLLNAQTGDIVPVDFSLIGADRLPLADRTVDAKRYRLTTDDQVVDLWYSNAGQWLALQTTVDGGRTLRYRLQQPLREQPTGGGA